MEDRKKDHINLALESQTLKDEIDQRFWYEPLLSAHPTELTPMSFLGKTFRVPLWVSSMTGGTQLAGKINSNLAKACREFGFGMGLGSCRIILRDNTHFADFDMREIIGDELPLYANLGICQMEELVVAGKTQLANDLVKKLRADGLIIHINPLQEWFQPEGDRLNYPPLYTIQKFLEKSQFPVIVKEVGQGMGPKSLHELMKLPLAAIEFASFGGTNFARMEMLRNPDPDITSLLSPLTQVGVVAEDMVNAVNSLVENSNNLLCKEIIVSGGIKSFLDGYYYIHKSKLTAVYGQASAFLKYAQADYSQLQQFIKNQIKGLEMAYAYLQIRK
ncbi:MAG: type 2 isopentenyl-diphosphate Delta-isomerase [Bacteroidetes bacterium]|nr:type 2 isopentenyl-diphosphate Delta-isomerase [Bacteroidota bacterium]